MTRPNAIGIGAQKCASSFIHAVLGSHPQADVATDKELDFFSYYFDHGYRWYETHFEGMNCDIRFEASPSYFHDPRAPQRVHDFDPGMRIVCLLRDPVERAFSNHLHELIKGHIPASTSFEDGLANNPSYTEQGMYADHLHRWFSCFDKDQILVLLAEDVRRDTAAQAARVYEFLGIEQDFSTNLLSERRNVSDRARFGWLRATLRAQGQAMRRMGLEEQLAALKKVTPFRQLLKMNSVDVRDEIPPMRAETRQRLTETFADQIIETENLSGRDLSLWPSHPDHGTQ